MASMLNTNKNVRVDSYIYLKVLCSNLIKEISYCITESVVVLEFGGSDRTFWKYASCTNMEI